MGRQGKCKIANIIILNRGTISKVMVNNAMKQTIFVCYLILVA